MHLFSNYSHYSQIFLLFFALAGCKQVHFPKKMQQPLPQDRFIQVYFNHSQTSRYQEPYRLQTRSGDNLEKQIINVISQANHTIDIAVQELRLPKIAEALVNKHQAGVKVRIILENKYSRPWSSFTSAEIQSLPQRERQRYQDFAKFADINQNGKLSKDEIAQRDALLILQNAKIPVIDDTADGSKGSGLMHHKFVIVDHRFVIVTSSNLTLSGIHGDYNSHMSLGNVNNLLKIDSPKLATLFTEEFNIMWGDGVGGKTDSKFGIKKPLREARKVILGNSKITVNFSPISRTKNWVQTSNGLIGKSLKSASKSIDMALFVFSAQQLANILEWQNKKQVKIRALIEKDFAYRPYSEALDMMGIAISRKCKYEPDNHPWQNPIKKVGIPLLPKGDLLHHKFAVIDRKLVITGSHNWSEAANYKNDETVLIVENPRVAAHYVREFKRLYTDATLGISDKIKRKIKSNKQKCMLKNMR